MKISELAKAANCSVQTIRYYENEGLLPEPMRSANNYRQYNQQHLEALRFIRYCRHLDMTHNEIRVLLNARDRPEDNCELTNQVIIEHLGHVENKIKNLQHLQKELRSLQDKCQRPDGNNRECGILHDMEARYSQQ